jgi:hypothetical protein
MIDRVQPRRAMAGSVLLPVRSGDFKVAAVSDTVCVTPYQQYEPDEPRGWSPIAVALIATLVLLLGLAGAVYGIQAANRRAPTPSPSAVPQIFPTPTPAPATPTSGPVPTETGAPADAFPVPDVTTGDFQAARKTIRELRLGWQLVFEGTDPADGSVRATEPAAGTKVKKGTTVKIFVRGAAPPATVPGVMGLTCSQAAGIIVEQGLYPQYETGREGVVQSQSPSASDPQTLRWNDRVRISCGTS